MIIKIPYNKKTHDKILHYFPILGIITCCVIALLLGVMIIIKTQSEIMIVIFAVALTLVISYPITKIILGDWKIEIQFKGEKLD